MPVNYISHIILMILMFSILGMSLNLLLGFTGQMALVHAALYASGAYALALLGMYFGANFFAALISAVVVTAILGAIIARSALRVQAEYFVLLTLSFQMVIYGLISTENPVTGGFGGLVNIGRPEFFGITLVTPPSYLPLLIVLAGICFFVIWRITHSPFGRVLKALREDEEIALSFAKDINRFKVLAFVVAGGVAAVAGGFMASYLTFISPAFFTVEVTIFIVALVALGGTANLWGSIIGAIIVITIPELLTFFGGNWSFSIGGRFMDISAVVDVIRAAIYGALLILFMRFRPQGIIPEYARFRWRKPPVYEKLSPEEGALILWGAGTDPGTSEAQSNPELLIDIRGLSKNFGGLRAVDNLTLTLPKQKITALIGPNGAGKTTIFNLVTGSLSTDEGKVYYRGKDITKSPSHKIARLGMVRTFQGARILPGMIVLENVLVARPKQSGENLLRLFFTPWRVAREEKENRRFAMACLGFVGLAERAGDMAEDLSFADRKLLQLACLLATEPDVMLLDEPVSGIDLAQIDNVLVLIRQMVKQGKTVCIIEHNLDVVTRLADSAYFLDQGKIVATGTPKELIADQKLVDLYFGI